LFSYFIAIPKKQNEKKSETGFCSETGFSNQDTIFTTQFI
jgi:hypothetical protein